MMIPQHELADILCINAALLLELAATHRLPFSMICGEFHIDHADIGAWSRALTWRRNLRP